MSFTLHNKDIRTLIVTLMIVCISALGRAQDCSDAGDNVLCVDSPSHEMTDPNSPFAYGCMAVSQSYFYTFQTNSVASSKSIRVTVTNEGCRDFLGQDSIYVMIVRLLNGGDPCNPAHYSNPICFGDSVNSFSFQLNNLLNSQEYLMVVGSNHDPNYGDCPFSVQITGDALSLVAGVNPLRINLGDPAQLYVEGQDEGSVLQWTPAEFLDNPTSDTPIALPDQTTVFTVTGNVGNCIVTDMITVTVAPPLDIYNTFTPNGDGINETWKIGRIEKFPNCLVQVYDRWGQLVFKSIGYSQPWDGTNKGKELPMAAYYYVIELNSLDVKIPPITGVVSIVR
ncbi:MAG TPA: gliding motility-associated C-terminal domain-containing protein [Flavobacteriales bacterium]